ncbi:MAG: Fic family protein [Blastocatellia bacterium]
MQGPPDRRSPPILFTRPANEWINRLKQKHKELAALSLTPGQKRSLDGWEEAEFVGSTLRLDRINVSRDSIARAASAAPIDAGAADDDALAVADLLTAVRMIKSAAGTSAAALTPDLLARLHDPSGRGEGFRKSAGDTGRALKPAPAPHLAAAIESACRWFTAESFEELNPVEQASIVYLRLTEIQPFERENERTALVAASLFTLRGGLPLIIIPPGLHGAYRAAIEEGARMNTKPMVELVADAVCQSIAEMIRLAGET